MQVVRVAGHQPAECVLGVGTCCVERAGDGEAISGRTGSGCSLSCELVLCNISDKIESVELFLVNSVCGEERAVLLLLSAEDGQTIVGHRCRQRAAIVFAIECVVAESVLVVVSSADAVVGCVEHVGGNAVIGGAAVKSESIFLHVLDVGLCRCSLLEYAERHDDFAEFKVSGVVIDVLAGASHGRHELLVGWLAADEKFHLGTVIGGIGKDNLAPVVAQALACHSAIETHGVWVAHECELVLVVGHCSYLVVLVVEAEAVGGIARDLQTVRRGGADDVVLVILRVAALAEYRCIVRVVPFHIDGLVAFFVNGSHFCRERFVAIERIVAVAAHLCGVGEETLISVSHRCPDHRIIEHVGGIGHIVAILVVEFEGDGVCRCLFDVFQMDAFHVCGGINTAFITQIHQRVLAADGALRTYVYILGIVCLHHLPLVCCVGGNRLIDVCLGEQRCVLRNSERTRCAVEAVHDGQVIWCSHQSPLRQFACLGIRVGRSVVAHSATCHLCRSGG